MTDAITSSPEHTLKSESMTEMVMVNTTNLLDQGIDLKDILSRIELNYIRDALLMCNGVVSHAAVKLGLRRTTLIEKMRKYNI